MQAVATLLESVSSPEVITAAVAQQITELAGGRWCGVQQTDSDPIMIFCDPITGSSCALPAEGFSVDGVIAAMKAACARFRIGA